MSAIARQLPLFGGARTGSSREAELSFASVERIDLGQGAWLELARGWLPEHAALFEQLLRDAPWRSEERAMYERRVVIPRLTATLGADELPPWVVHVRAALDARYGARFDRLGLALYRDGNDSVAWHGDRVARRMPEALVATVSLGAPRRFLVRPTGGGRSLALPLGWGDLLVMGGSCQRTHQHCIPKVAHAEPRIAVMFRPTWEPGGGQGVRDAQGRSSAGTPNR
jgi:alkylated DNA repair dioxygenase AlkB